RPGCDPEPLLVGDLQPADQLGKPVGRPQPHPGHRLCEGDGGTDPQPDPAAGWYGDAGPGQVDPAERAEPAAVIQATLMRTEPLPWRGSVFSGARAGMDLASHPA